MTIHRKADAPDGTDLAAIDESLPDPDKSFDVHTDLAAAIGRLDTIPPHGGQNGQAVSTPHPQPADGDSGPAIDHAPRQASAASLKPVTPATPRTSAVAALLAEMGALRRQLREAGTLWASQQTEGAGRAPAGVPDSAPEVPEQLRALSGDLARGVDVLLGELKVIGHRVDHSIQIGAGDASPLRDLVLTASAKGALLAQISEVGGAVEHADGPWPSTEVLPLSGVVAELAALRDRLERVSDGVRSALVEHHSQIVDEVRVVVEEQHRQIVGEVREMIEQQQRQQQLPPAGSDDDEKQAARGDPWGRT